MAISAGSPRLFGAVFAGGKSVRMGADKALLTWPDQEGSSVTLVERAATTLTRLCERVEIAEGRAGRLEQDRWPTFPDVAEGQGPLAGLVAALERAAELGLDGVVALACDMPLVGERELSALVDAVGGDAPCSDAALWVVDGRDQPLCAVYRLSCLAPARRAFDAGARRVVALFGESVADGRSLRLDRLNPDENSARRLVNLNSMNDYDRALLVVTGGVQRATGPAADPITSRHSDHRDGPER